MMARTLCALALAALATPSLADVRSMSGHALDLDMSTGSDVRVLIDPGDADTIEIIGKGSLDCAGLRDGGQVTLPSCLDDVDNLTVRIPSGSPITIRHSGSGDLKIVGSSGAAGPLRLVQTGSGDISVARAAVLDAELSGSGNFRIGAVSGPAQLALNGSSDAVIGNVNGALRVRGQASGGLVVGSAELGDADIDLRGSGDVMIGGGHIGHLRAITTGSGNIVVAAQIAVAEATTSGDGDIRLARATGPVQQHASGGGEIKVGGSDILNAVLGRVGDALADKQFASIVGADVDRKVADANARLAEAERRVSSLSPSPPSPPSPPEPPDSTDAGGSSGSLHAHDGGNWLGHAVAGVIVAGLVFWGWRLVQRRGGAASFRGAKGPVAAPSHPGVVALGETMARLDGRLARVEGYVTSKEFELHREFRALDRGQAR